MNFTLLCYYYWMTQTSGLAMIAIAVAASFLLWRLVLGRVFGELGFTPLTIGYICATLGLVLLCFGGSIFFFYDDIYEKGSLWSLVPGWTRFSTVLSLLVVLPLLELICMPICAILLKRRRFTKKAIGAVVFAVWFGLLGSFLAFLTLLSQKRSLSETVSDPFALIHSVVVASMVAFLVCLPFSLGVYFSTRRYRNAAPTIGASEVPQHASPASASDGL